MIEKPAREQFVANFGSSRVKQLEVCGVLDQIDLYDANGSLDQILKQDGSLTEQERRQIRRYKAVAILSLLFGVALFLTGGYAITVDHDSPLGMLFLSPLLVVVPITVPLGAVDRIKLAARRRNEPMQAASQLQSWLEEDEYTVRKTARPDTVVLEIVDTVNNCVVTRQEFDTRITELHTIVEAHADLVAAYTGTNRRTQMLTAYIEAYRVEQEALREPTEIVALLNGLPKELSSI